MTLLWGIGRIGISRFHRMITAVVPTIRFVVVCLVLCAAARSGVTAVVVHHNYDLPLTWVGGVARSGTTLMRSLLDVHPSMRCGPETSILIHMMSAYLSATAAAAPGAPGASRRLPRMEAAGVRRAAFDAAYAAYYLSIIVHHGDAALRYCNKDPFLFRQMDKLLRQFRRSKFVFMIRDARGGISSLIENKVNTGKSFNLSDHAQCMSMWQEKFVPMLEHCITLGPNRCLPVYYEKLVIDTEATLRGIIDFLGMEWNNDLLRHEEMLGTNNALVFPFQLASKYQVVKGIYNGSLASWKKHIPTHVQEQAIDLAPILQTLGYAEAQYASDYRLLPHLDFASKFYKTLWHG